MITPHQAQYFTWQLTRRLWYANSYIYAAIGNLYRPLQRELH